MGMTSGLTPTYASTPLRQEKARNSCDVDPHYEHYIAETACAGQPKTHAEDWQQDESGCHQASHGEFEAFYVSRHCEAVVGGVVCHIN
jgi:hypothetical protein